MTFRLLKFCLSAAIVLVGSGMSVADLHSTLVPRYDGAVAKAVAYLQANRGQIPERAKTLAAYALLKAGVELTDGVVAEGVAIAKARAENESYTGYEQIYLAGVDAMLLAEVDPQKNKAALQMIANFISSRQHTSGGWSESQTDPDTSMAQYAMLALWAAQRAGATISPETVDRSIGWHLATGTPDGGWEYRPHQKKGKAYHNMVVAGAGSLAIGRLMLHGPEIEVEAEKMFGVLEKATDLATNEYGFPNYRSRFPPSAIDAKISRAFDWLSPRFPPPQGPPDSTMPYYFFYALERVAALYELEDAQGKGWFETYGDVLLTMQNASGAFDRGNENYTSASEGTSFAILYFMRSTQQIMDKQYGLGQLLADRGNPFGDQKRKEPTELDVLIADISKMDFEKLDETPVEVADEIVRSVLAIDDPEKLVGQEEQLKSLMKHPNDKVRSAAVWALGRTGDFALVPLMLDGIRDPSVDVNIEAIQALRFISRKPQGFGETLAPFASLGTDEQIGNAAPEERLRLATPWREKALKDWSNWYFSVRPFEDRGGIDELQLAVPLQKQP